jgi:hypothetical protein
MTEPKIEIPKELLEQMDKEQPSTEPSYWAKPNCTTCLGRGKLGKIKTVLPGGGNNVIEQDESTCYCALRRFKKWQDEWLAAHRPVPVKPANGNGTSKPAPPVTRTLERLDRIDDMLAEMKGEAHQLATFIDSLPQKTRLEDIDREIGGHQEGRASTEDQSRTMDERAKGLREQAALLVKQATELEHGAAYLRDKVVPEFNKNLGTLTAEQERVRREYHAQAHKWGRKYRILEDKITKLERRRSRVAQDGGISLDVPPPPQQEAALDQ